jgi:intracellular sulfur oxidation DsrE/DsrF family protein
VVTLKALFQVNKLGDWKTALGNITNFPGGLEEGEDSIIWVVVNGDAVLIVKDAESMEKIEALARDSKVSFFFCKNSIRHHEIKEDDLPSFIDKVKAGATFIARAQNLEGFSYQKP